MKISIQCTTEMVWLVSSDKWKALRDSTVLKWFNSSKAINYVCIIVARIVGLHLFWMMCILYMYCFCARCIHVKYCMWSWQCLTWLHVWSTIRCTVLWQVFCCSCLIFLYYFLGFQVEVTISKGKSRLLWRGTLYLCM